MLAAVTIPKEWVDFLVQHFMLLWWLVVAGMVTMFAVRFFWHRSRGRFFADPDPATVIYQESFASGRSLKSFRTRLGGAGNCLKVMLTRKALWVRPIFPFLIIGPELDLVHEIPLASIQSVEERPRIFGVSHRILFRLTDGTLRTLVLVSKSPREFATALSVAVERTRTGRTTPPPIPR